MHRSTYRVDCLTTLVELARLHIETIDEMLRTITMYGDGPNDAYLYWAAEGSAILDDCLDWTLRLEVARMAATVIADTHAGLEADDERAAREAKENR